MKYKYKYLIDMDDREVSDGNHYLRRLMLSYEGVEMSSVGHKSAAIRFDDMNQAQVIANYVGGRVEEEYEILLK